MKLKTGSDRFGERLTYLKRTVFKYVNSTLLWLSILNFTVIIFDFGFDHSQPVKNALEFFYSASLVTGFICLSLRLLLLPRLSEGRAARFAEYAVFGFQIVVIISRFVLRGWLADNAPYVRSLFFIYLLFIIVFFIELSKVSLSFYRIKFSPALLYVGSFLVLMAFGTGLLLLPKATVNGISYIDAFFTATSAVCVTGLIVVDTATHFTTTGKLIILLLIQIGGLGVMTLTSFLGFFFQGAYSYQNQIFIKDFINEDKIGQIFRTLFKIIFITLGIEAVGALFIYLTLDPRVFADSIDRVQFAVFHSVSAFCNAGFSTLTDGLYDPLFRENYSFQLVIALLIILGGIGFPVIFNYYQYYKSYLGRKRRKILHLKGDTDVVALNVNTRLILITTFVLLVLGTALFYISEQGNVLADRSLYGQFVTSFFGSVSPRTAGFNTFDMTALSTPTILFYLLFMWIGASPGSTEAVSRRQLSPLAFSTPSALPDQRTGWNFSGGKSPVNRSGGLLP